jgi:hypothetical protein
MHTTMQDKPNVRMYYSAEYVKYELITPRSVPQHVQHVRKQGFSELLVKENLRKFFVVQQQPLTCNATNIGMPIRGSVSGGGSSTARAVLGKKRKQSDEKKDKKKKIFENKKTGMNK